MKRFVFFLFFFSLFFSCKEIYKPEIDTNKQFLVVEGLLTDEPIAYQIKLSYTVPYDEKKSGIPVKDALVYVKDNLGQSFQFEESTVSPGSYYSNPSEFIGSEGKEYTLFIVTSDGESYQSTPQILLNNVKPIDAFGVKAEKKVLTEINNNYIQITKEGAEVYFTYSSINDTVPHFKYHCTQFYGAFGVLRTFWQGAKVEILTYRWRLIPYLSDFSLSDEKFNIIPQNTMHEVYFCEKIKTIGFLDFNGSLITLDSAKFIESNSLESLNIVRRTLYIKQYRLNNDAFVYYKSVEAQLNATNKIFDPVNPQIIGNISCSSDPEKTALGFFETSPIAYLAYSIQFNFTTGEATFTPKKYLMPSKYYGESIRKPIFWDN
jgi:hypothetical protein